MKRVLFLLFVLWASLFSTSMSAQDSYLVVNTSVLRYNPDGATQTFEITSNVDWTISVEGGDEWIEVTPLSGNGNKEISVSATTNTNTDPREATISISGNGLSQTVKIYQAGTGYLTTNKTRFFNPDEGTQTFDITSNVDWTISVEGGDGWLTVSPMSGSGNQTITVKVEELNGYSLSPHFATIIISSGKLTQTIDVYHYSSPYLAVSTNDIRFGFDKSTQEFRISSNVDWDISIEGGTGWLTVTPQSGSGDKEISVSATANTGSSPRAATITISNGVLTQTINVIQVCRHLSVTPKTLLYNETNGNQTILITSNVEWSISVEGGEGWITVSPMNGQGDQEVLVKKSATGDPNGGPYHAIITVAGGGLTQTVEAWAPWSHYLTVDTSHLDFNCNGGKQTFSITSNRDWDISVDGGDGWLEVTPLSGDGSKEITVSATTNTDTDPREASITVSGYWISQTIKIYQAGDRYLSVTPSNIIFNEIAGAQTINVTSNVDWNISVEGGSGWLTISQVNGVGNADITIQVNSNNSFSIRQATITVYGQGGLSQVIKVLQYTSTPPPRSEQVLTFNPNSSRQNVIVYFFEDSELAVDGGKGWLTINPLSGEGWTELIIAVSENDGNSPRTVTITISGGGMTQTINVTQLGNAYLTASTTNIRFSPIETLQKFNITSNVDWTISVEGGDGWISVSPMSGTGNQEVSVTAEEYREQYPMPHYGNATIIITGAGLTQTIRVISSGVFLVLSTDSLHFSNSGDMQTLGVASNNPFSLTIEDGEWVSIDLLNDDGINRDYSITVKENNGLSNRKDTITIEPYGLPIIKYVIITQSGTDDVKDITMKSNDILKEENTLFDLSGRRTTCSTNDLGKLRQGVYILNGKKYLIK